MKPITLKQIDTNIKDKTKLETILGNLSIYVESNTPKICISADNKGNISIVPLNGKINNFDIPNDATEILVNYNTNMTSFHYEKETYLISNNAPKEIGLFGRKKPIKSIYKK